LVSCRRRHASDDETQEKSRLFPAIQQKKASAPPGAGPANGNKFPRPSVSLSSHRDNATEEAMQNANGSKQRMVRASILGLLLLASFASAAHAGPNDRFAAGMGITRPHFSHAMPKAQRYGAAVNGVGAARDAGTWRYGDERDFESFLRDE
jgi:hypothetical protein